MPSGASTLMPTSSQTRLVTAPATSAEIDSVLNETYKLWGLELGHSAYVDFIWGQLTHPWGRRHFKYWVGRCADQVVTSCKLYDLEFRARGRSYKIGGLGAVFTPERYRGSGYAASALEQLSEHCRGNGYDGLLLHSDIDVSYYERLGYVEMGSCDFQLPLPDVSGAGVKPLASSLLPVRPVTLLDVPAMVRHYQRWLSRCPYGIDRSEDYWHYKLGKELTMEAQSTKMRPTIEILETDFATAGGGYALIEYAHSRLRVLEVCGAPGAVERLWQGILALAHERGARLVRGWVGVAPQNVISMRWLTFVERRWARPMLKPFCEEVESWLDQPQSMLLEMGHF